MAVGLPLKTTYANGDVYSASDVNDTNGTVNLFTSSTLSVAAGKNSAVINGGMDIWQRGTSITVSSFTYTADRWQIYRAVAGATVTRQATGDTTNLPNIQYCMRVSRDSGNTSTSAILGGYSNESANSIPYAGKTVTLSFYARKGANFSNASSQITVDLKTGTGTDQNVLSAGYTGGVLALTVTPTLTTTWQRFTGTVTLASNTTEIGLYLTSTPVGTAGAADYYEITGVQLELGSTATTFSRAGGTIQGELAACQRYYSKSYNQATTPGTDITSSYSGAVIFGGWGSASAAKVMQYPHKVTMRTTPTISFWDLGGNASKITTFDTGFSRTNNVSASGGTIISEDNHSVNPGTSTINGWSWCYAASAEL